MVEYEQLQYTSSMDDPTREEPSRPVACNICMNMALDDVEGSRCINIRIAAQAIGFAYS